jgi:hypothetical protein
VLEKEAVAGAMQKQEETTRAAKALIALSY